MGYAFGDFEFSIYLRRHRDVLWNTDSSLGHPDEYALHEHLIHEQFTY